VVFSITPKKIYKKNTKNKHEMIVHLNEKLSEKKGLLQFANQNILDTATSDAGIRVFWRMM